ncbi:GNAT family N-acetyltransferase [Anianabacter salinae]|uniref:GNAT family N-acetyltransferase n=1 Tax=Anianabacter salinae TaxID=2851023 RepID=UPI00225E5667|nr:GNAT family N-acetyltransferase [Anianabacter salinae]MBV0913972.1 GNAT family N-acetyltransferase [Anianabacter salinae]
MTPGALAELHAQCFDTPPPWSAESFADLLSDPHVFLLKDRGAALVGRAAAGEAELLTLAVPPEARRHGIASALLDNFQAEATRRGAVTAFLEVSAENAAARALYAAAGWHEVGRRPRYYRTPGGLSVDALVLSKALCSS